jgi:hypothetical protein
MNFRLIRRVWKIVNSVYLISSRRNSVYCLIMLYYIIIIYYDHDYDYDYDLLLLYFYYIII